MKIFEVISEDKKTWYKDGVEMCSKDCCGQPVTECTCGPDCKHCDCYKLNERYGLRTGGPAFRQAGANQTNQMTRANNQAQNMGRELEIKTTHAQRKLNRMRKAPTGIPARLLQPQLPGSPEPEQTQ